MFMGTLIELAVLGGFEDEDIASVNPIRRVHNEEVVFVANGEPVDGNPNCDCQTLCYN